MGQSVTMAGGIIYADCSGAACLLLAHFESQWADQPRLLLELKQPLLATAD